ncbi:MAG TPA: response regulator [Vicinamibacterales bacterium]|nr:response regulator [Vicinamibacterales bacterium]
MPYQFDGESFGLLLDDAHKLRDGASALERKLADLAAGPMASTCGDAYAASREQKDAADAILRRFVGSGAEDSGARDRPIVLVVDDSQEAREATALLLEHAGFQALTAANGLEALIVAHYARPAVALLDLMMPVLDGLQTARLLSESHSTAHVKVIAYSGRTDMFSRRLPGTFSAILAKPTGPDELLTLVQQYAGVA